MTRKKLTLELWMPSLCCNIIDGNNLPTKIDFNRLRYFSLPTTKVIKANGVKLAGRDNLVIHLFNVITENELLASSTKGNLFNRIIIHFKYCDANGLEPFTKEGVYNEILNSNLRQRRGEIKDATETSQRSTMRNLLSLMNLPSRDWFPNIAISGVSQRESIKAYSQSELKKMLPLLRSIFKQLYFNFVKNPAVHLKANHFTPTMTVIWEGKTHTIRSAINKLFSVATFLLSYYTWSNSAQLFDLKRPTIAIHDLPEKWYQMPVFKRRSFKSLTVEIGDNYQLHLPKYALDFFLKLLHVSSLLDPGPDALLLVSVCEGKINPMNGHILQVICSGWLTKHFPLQDDRGETLKPLIRRFRATGGSLTTARHGFMAASLLLDNTPATVLRSYSEGNPNENDRMLKDAVNTLEMSARYNLDVDSIKQIVRDEQKVKVLAYEEYIEKYNSISRNAHGVYCKDPMGKEANVYNKHVSKHHLSKHGEKLACADLLKCFECEHQVFVESIEDVWCLLSFRECIEESSYMHIDNSHFIKNFNGILKSIDNRLEQLNHKVLLSAQRKLNSEGRHPLWQDATNTYILGKRNNSCL